MCMMDPEDMDPEDGFPDMFDCLAEFDPFVNEDRCAEAVSVLMETLAELCIPESSEQIEALPLEEILHKIKQTLFHRRTEVSSEALSEVSNQTDNPKSSR